MDGNEQALERIYLKMIDARVEQVETVTVRLEDLQTVLLEKSKSEKRGDILMEYINSMLPPQVEAWKNFLASQDVL